MMICCPTRTEPDDPVPYTASCGECGGSGGHPINDPRAGADWEDCPHCRRYDSCYLCDREIDCRDREPDRLLIGGAPEVVCRVCWSRERE
jgi:hypothetical protein